MNQPVPAMAARSSRRRPPAVGPNPPGDLASEIKLFLDLGMDGFFTDNSDIGVAARDAWVEAG